MCLGGVGAGEKNDLLDIHCLPLSSFAKVGTESEQKNVCFTAVPSYGVDSCSPPPLPLASSTSCTFGNMLTGYLKAVNCSESFTYWVMGHVCLIKIQLLHCTMLGNLSSQVMKYDEIG